jgi:hypothetical protein
MDRTDNMGDRGEQTTEELRAVLPTRRVQSVVVTESRASVCGEDASVLSLAKCFGCQTLQQLARNPFRSHQAAPLGAGGSVSGPCGVLQPCESYRGHELRRGGPSHGMRAPDALLEIRYLPVVDVPGPALVQRVVGCATANCSCLPLLLRSA